MRVRDIMSTDLVTVGLEDDLQTAVTRMLENRVGSVVVESDGEPAGIVTETDVLAAGTSFEALFSGIPVTRAMSENPVTTDPETPLEDAVDTMHEYGIKKLPVVEDGALVGIVTLTDLVYHRHDLASEARELERRRDDEDPGRPAE
jgi:CBS domain-containing protein